MPGPLNSPRFGSGDFAAIAPVAPMPGPQQDAGENASSGPGGGDLWSSAGGMGSARPAFELAMPSDASPSWGDIPAPGRWGAPPDASHFIGGGGDDTQAVSGGPYSPGGPQGQGGLISPALATASPGGAGTGGPGGSVVSSSLAGDGPTGAANSPVPTPGNAGAGTSAAVRLAPSFTIEATVFTAALSGGRSANNGGALGRVIRDDVTSNREGGAANGSSDSSDTTAQDAAAVPGVINTTVNGGGVVVATLALNSAVTVGPLGVAAGNTDGRAIFDGSTGTALATDLSGGTSPTRSAGAGPLGPVSFGGRARVGSDREPKESPGDRIATGLDAPAPQHSDLLTDFKPFDRGSLEDAIDRFLGHFDDFGTELSRGYGPTDLMIEIMAVAVAFTAAKVGLRLFWRPRDDEASLTDGDVCVHLDPFPGPLDL